MAYRQEKTENGVDLVIDGFENGVATSAYQGIGNVQNGNISTQPGEIMASFSRTLNFNTTAGSGTLIPLSTNTVSYTGISVPVGTWITITADNGTGLSGTYYVLDTNKLSRTFSQDISTAVTGINFTGGTPTTVFLTSGTTWAVPVLWPSSNNTIEVIGAGGGGGSGLNSGTSGAGGGGGAYSKISNLVLTFGNSVTYSVGSAGAGGSGSNGGTGGDTYFNGASLGASSVGAKGGVGGGGNGTLTGGTGGQASSGIGTTKFSGGTGGNGDTSGGTAGGGGAGAAGLNGAGGNGIIGSGTAFGGTGDNGFGGAGATINGGAGGNGTEYDASHGSGGGGCGGANNQVGGAGGTYGAGGAGGGATNHNGGSGSQGLVVIKYTPTTSPSATFTIVGMGQPLQSAYEKYTDSNNVTQYRYYILDSLANVWIHDTAQLVTVTTPNWFISELPPTLSGRIPGGLAVLNGWVTFTISTSILWKSTSTLNASFAFINYAYLTTNTYHQALVGHQGAEYLTDGNHIASIFPDASLSTTNPIANLQSYAQYTAVTTTGTVTALLNGGNPITVDASGSIVRIPVVFLSTGTLPTSITANVIYHVQWLNSGTTFQVYAAPTGGSALDIQTGATGNQFFNTFSPFSPTTFVFTLQALNLPAFEQAQCLGELGNIVLVGGMTNTVYPWNQVSVTPDNIIPLPEGNVVKITTVNNLAYVFAGQKGNIYISNSSSIQHFTSVPDYCAGIPGTPSSYIEPYFSWGDVAFIRGRVYFSILDQTATKTGNCGGIWSFVPSNNFQSNEVGGIALRLENKSSYGTYNGLSTVLLPNQNQNAIGPQFWSGWYSSITSPTYGFDYTGTTPNYPVIIETDLIPTGTILTKKTFSQIEYKLSTPLATGESVNISYRQNSTDAYTSCGTVIADSVTVLSGYFRANFQKGQWLQLQVVLNPVNTSASSFVRLKEVRIR